MNRLLSGLGLLLLGLSLWNAGALALPLALVGLVLLSLRTGGDPQGRQRGTS